MEEYNSQVKEITESLLISGSHLHISRLASCILRHIQDDPLKAEAIWHPLGFACFVLKREGNRTLRLHVWSPLPGEYTGVGWQVHKHSWSLVSYVLCGSIENCIYVVRPNLHSPTHQLYKIDYKGQVNYLRATGIYVQCVTSQVEHITAGDSYILNPGIYHSARVPTGSVVATIVIATEVDGVDTAVLGEVNSGQYYRTERRPCSTDFILKSLGIVLRTMQDNVVGQKV